MTCIEDNAGLHHRDQACFGWAILPPHPTSWLLIMALNCHLVPIIASAFISAVAQLQQWCVTVAWPIGVKLREISDEASVKEKSFCPKISREEEICAAAQVLPPPQLTAKNSPGGGKSWVLGRNQALNEAMPEAISTLHCATTRASGSSPPSLFSALGQFGFAFWPHTTENVLLILSPLHPQVLISCLHYFLLLL